MKIPHKHAELIKAWADGAEIEVTDGIEPWTTTIEPFWRTDCKYRIKPEIKSDVVMFCYANVSGIQRMTTRKYNSDNLKLTFDGETGNLIKVELV